MMAGASTPSTAPSTPSKPPSFDSDTLASYVTNYKIENGRRYHSYKDGSYWGPNDEPAAEGLDMGHEMYNLTLGALHLAPLIRPKEILDVGTGTGIWAIDMADTYPDAQVTGTDLSPIQPELVPPNCVFEIDDASLEWTWDDNTFDFVHLRDMLGCIADWDGFLAEAMRCTKPGGWVEIVDHSTCPVADNGSMPPGHFYKTWERTMGDTARRWGKSFDVWSESRVMLERAGFVDVVERRFKWPINDWPSDPKLRHLGCMNFVRVTHGLEGFMLRLLTSAVGWTVEQAQVFLAEMRMAMRDKNVHAYLPVTVVYGRKPR